MLLNVVMYHLQQIYADIALEEPLEAIAARIVSDMRLSSDADGPAPYRDLWNQTDMAVITYGDTITASGEHPLATLRNFLDDNLRDLVSIVHVLPYFPWTSDDGFAVMDYSSVNEALGSWDDVESLADHYRLMSDLVINHCSSRSPWFENFKAGVDPGRSYFMTVSEDMDLSTVVRPRTSPLVMPVETAEGTRHVWCTFSHDQVDFDFRNPAVLEEFVRIIRQHLDSGVRIFRLDAVAFLWKVAGTPCINLRETHEMIRLLRTLIEHACPDCLIITETNIPNRENLTYFGNANEGHAIYNFSLPPLLVYTLISGHSRYLSQWLMTMPKAQHGTTYFNFIASHDGIGLRPVEGLLQDEEIDTFIDTMQLFGGRVSWRAGTGGRRTAYEINISLFDALQGTVGGFDRFGFDRFVCAHAIMLALEGIPAFYIHSFFGTRNDHARVEHTGHNRSINRSQWDIEELRACLDREHGHYRPVFDALRDLMAIRRQQPAFHPEANQVMLQMADGIFGFWRQTPDREQTIYCLFNISDTERQVALLDINLRLRHAWTDLIAREQYPAGSEALALQPYQAVWLTDHPR